MSGHSKWANIKRGKAIVDAKRSNAFTKLSRLITVAVRTGGGPDPDVNFKLRLALTTARSQSLPKDTIDKAIQRGLGVGGDTEIESLIYEGFASGGVALIIEATTDNRNRAVNEIKKTLSDFDGALGTSGSTQWMFEQRGRLIIPAILSENLQLESFDYGVIDLSEHESQTMIETSALDFARAQAWANEKLPPALEAGLVFVPKNLVPVPDQNNLMELLETLESLDDVQNVYHNGDLTE